MAVTTVIPVEEYPRTVYRPDCDYAGGQLVERNWGEIDHSDAQSLCLFQLKSRYRGYWVGVEARVPVKPDRFRVPDVVAVKGTKPNQRVLMEPPASAVEILSPEDRMSSMWQRIDDYLNFGVPFVWVIDPATRRGYVYTTQGSVEAKDGVMRAGELEVPLAAIVEG